MKYTEKAQFETADAFGIGAPNDAYAQYFVGQSFLKPLTEPGKAPVFLANVTFEPAAGTTAHSPRHQRRRTDPGLHCRRGLVSEEGKPAVELKPGMGSLPFRRRSSTGTVPRRTAGSATLQ